MAPKVSLMLILLLLLSPIVYAVEPIQPIAQTEQIIIYQHEQTRTWCQTQWDSKETSIRQALEDEKNDLEARTREVLWLDRLLSFISIFLACFLAFSLRSFLNSKNKRKLEAIDKMEHAKQEAELPPLSEAPKPTEPTPIKEAKLNG